MYALVRKKTVFFSWCTVVRYLPVIHISHQKLYSLETCDPRKSETKLAEHFFFFISILCLQRSKGFHSAEMFFDDLDCRDLGDADKPLQYSL